MRGGLRMFELLWLQIQLFNTGMIAAECREDHVEMSMPVRKRCQHCAPSCACAVGAAGGRDRARATSCAQQHSQHCEDCAIFHARAREMCPVSDSGCPE